jgi:hypothetical protein
MGLKCSLFGHAFDERDVVRERDSTGSEVVTVVKDVERCTQCGTTRVVSTNKEVVSAAGATADGGVDAGSTLRTPGTDADDGADADAFDAADQLGTAGDGPGSAAEPGADGGEFADGAAGGTGDAFDGAGFEAPADDPAAGSTTDPDDEDATILSDDGNGTDGTTVLGDAADGAVDATESAAPETTEPTGAGGEDADPTTEDAEILTDDEPGDRAPGRWPGEDIPDAWEPEPLDERSQSDTASEDTGDADGETTETDVDDEAATEDGETPETTAEPAPDVEPAATASFTVPDGHYRCGECGHTIPASSSFRRGDACPECVHGYLEAGE